MDRTLVILNPWAGRGKAGRQWHALEHALHTAGVRFDAVTTEARGAMLLAQRGADEGYRQIVAVGGDGTINEVVNGIRQTSDAGGPSAQLGVVPLGTGSDFIKSVSGITPDDLTGAATRLARGTAQTVDIAHVTTDDGAARYFINGLGMGFDAAAAAEALKIVKVKGFAVYLLAIGRTLLHYRPEIMTVRYNDVEVHKPLMFTSVGNGRCQAGGFYLTPEAAIDDGELDVCMVDKLRLDQIVRHIGKVVRGTHIALPIVKMGRTQAITVSSETDIPVATDGEVISTTAREVRVTIVPKAIELIV
jgi:diacylglycerol kinase (ATP)